MLSLRKSLLIAVGISLTFGGVAFSQAPVAGQPVSQLPALAFDRLQSGHTEDSPLFVLQGEMDDLIGPDGGGACPLAAGLTAIQCLRLMAELPAEQQPHRLALRLLNGKPELLQGRIKNDRFVEVIKHLCESLDGEPITIQVISSPTSTHYSGGERWSSSEGPDLKVNARELKVLAYDVTLHDGRCEAGTSFCFKRATATKSRL